MFRNLDLTMLGPRIEIPTTAAPPPPAPVTTTTSPVQGTAPIAPASKDVTTTLENDELWKKFHALNTEMIITKTGR